ncbi:hypothetical protein [Glycomyces tenuis]|uniref:hypothetical protein n=1 Tax=Glycomyces tenuis TaxID=58116 RepID=UPI0004085B9C|nr:hypothetical protein [Glycomyces tenuis]
MHELHLNHTNLIDAIERMETTDLLGEIEWPQLRLFACWQRLDGTFDCRLLPTVTAALTDRIDRPVRGPLEQPFLAVLAESLTELCHPDGYGLAGIGLAADCTIEPVFQTWIALTDGTALKYQRHSGGAEARIHLKPGEPITLADTTALNLPRCLLERATGAQPHPYIEEPEPTEPTELDTLIASLDSKAAMWGVISAHDPNPTRPAQNAVELLEQMVYQLRPHLDAMADSTLSTPSIVRAVDLLLSMARNARQFTACSTELDQANAQTVNEAAKRAHQLAWPFRHQQILDELDPHRTDTTAPAAAASQR